MPAPRGDNRNVTLEPDLASPAPAPAVTRFPRSLCGPADGCCWPRRHPGTPAAHLASPSPGRAWPATDRGKQWAPPGSRFAGSTMAKLFFFFIPNALFLALFHVAPHAAQFMQACERTIIFSGGAHFVRSQLPARPSGCPRLFQNFLILWAHNSRHRAGARHLFASVCRHGLVGVWSTMDGRFDLPDFRVLLHIRYAKACKIVTVHPAHDQLGAR